ncbi:MAG: NADH-quinone oxidoreductase subunit N [Verrucomicrobiota bacterium]|nr:NADH-quinone oxidoreductase subunit N [Verrucomicrobiota bacterium]
MSEQLKFVQLEMMVVALGLIVLIADLVMPPSKRRLIGHLSAVALGLIFLFSLRDSYVGLINESTDLFFNSRYKIDGLAIFFKRFFILAAIFVLIFAVDFADRIRSGISEYYAFIIFALAGMMFAASANDFSMLFVSIELITVTFYILVSYQRHRLQSLEAGVKYLILGAVSSAFMIYGIALVFGEAGSLKFEDINAKQSELLGSKVFLFGMLFLFAGLAFKISAFPFQVWAPDVYQGAPTPTTAFLSLGSKAAGFVLLIRLLVFTIPDLTREWTVLLIGISAVTILYGNLCALPQRNLKRLLAYSGIANAGYLLMGIVAQSEDGTAAILYYLAGYLFALMTVFLIINLITKEGEGEDISCLENLNKRSPFLAAAMTLAAISLAGIPPLAGFFGKFLLIKSVAVEAFGNTGYFVLLAVAVFGVVISIYYYFGIVRAIFWNHKADDKTPIFVVVPIRFALICCFAGMLYLGLLPNKPMKWVESAAVSLIKTTAE